MNLPSVYAKRIVARFDSWRSLATLVSGDLAGIETSLMDSSKVNTDTLLGGLYDR